MISYIGSQRHDLLRLHKLANSNVHKWVSHRTYGSRYGIHTGEHYDFILKPTTVIWTMEKADYLVSADILSILICMIVPKLTSLLGLVSSIKITVKSAFLVEYLP